MPALLAATFLGFCGFAVLLPVAPLWAVRGGADEGGAGLVNGALLLVTVLTQFTVPGLLRRFGWGPVLAAGLVFLGAPSLGLIASDDLSAILALSAVRGVGFGIITVTGSAAVAELSDPHTRGAAVGAYGLAIAGPQVILLPLGSWVAETVGFTTIFVVGALPLLGMPAAIALGRVLEVLPASTSTEDVGGPSTARVAVTLLRPMLLLVGVTLAGGAVLTFGPQMITNPAVVIPALALMELMAAIARWGIGSIADRYGAERFLAPFVLLTILGVSGVAWAVHEDGDEPFDSHTTVDAERYPKLTAARVKLSKDEVDIFYKRFSKEAFWPTLHTFWERATFNEGDWQVFCKVNRAFAERTALEATEGAIVWLHDYNLWMVPAYLRELRPDVRIAFFHHTYFPSADVFNVVPWRREILGSLLQCDYIGFHIPRQVENFVDVVRGAMPTEVLEREGCAPRFLTYGCAVGLDEMITRIRVGDRAVGLGAHPVGTDIKRIEKGLAHPRVRVRLEQIRREFAGRKLVLSVERLDYTKGIYARLRAFAELMGEGHIDVDVFEVVEVRTADLDRARAGAGGGLELRTVVDMAAGDRVGGAEPGDVALVHDASAVPAGAGADAAYDGFVQWAAGRGLTLYPAQDEAVMELVSGAHVILSTPTGTGKSLVAIAAHAVALAAGGGWWWTHEGPGSTVVVPDVTGLSRADAEASLTQDGDLGYVESTAFDEQVPKGEVITSNPPTGTELSKGSDVTVVVSKGPERYEVPDLTGRTAAQARTTLERRTLTVGATTQAWDDDVAKGRIVSTTPAPGTEVKRDAKVALVVSKGPEPVAVPTVTGQGAEAATSAIEEAGLEVTRADDAYSTSVPKGSVISQSPSSGTLLPGETVTITVSKGPEMVAVPSVEGLSRSAATTKLEAAGFKVAVQTFLGGPLDEVRASRPSGGTAPKGSTVTILVV